MTENNTKIIQSVLDNVVDTDNTSTCLYRMYPKDAPWCMAGLQYLLRDLFEITSLPDTNSCTEFYTSVPVKLINHSYETAEPGDIILYQGFDSIPNDFDHVGIVYSNDHSTKTLRILEANHGNNPNEYNRWGFRTCSYIYPYLGCVIDMSDLMVNYCEHVYKPYTTNPPKSTPEPSESTRVDLTPYGIFINKIADYINTRALETISIDNFLSYLKGDE